VTGSAAPDGWLDAFAKAERLHIRNLLDGAVRSGHHVAVVEFGLARGDAFASAAPALPGPLFNTGNGIETSELLDAAMDHWQTHRTTGWIQSVAPPWRGAEPTDHMAIAFARPRQVPMQKPAGNVALRMAEPSEAGTWADVILAASPMPASVGPAWRDAIAAIEHGDEVHQLVLALQDDVPVGGARMTIAAGGALLGGAAVLETHRSLGIQRALISYRARLAIDGGAAWLAATSVPDGISERNLGLMGFQRAALRGRYPVPPTLPRA